MDVQNLIGSWIRSLAFKNFLKVLLGVFVLSVFFPKSHEARDYRKFISGFTFNINPSSPAYSVIADEYLDEAIEQSLNKPWIPEDIPATELRIESDSIGRLALALRGKASKVKRNIASSKIPPILNTKYRFKPMKINIAKALSEEGVKFSLKLEDDRVRNAEEVQPSYLAKVNQSKKRPSENRRATYKEYDSQQKMAALEKKNTNPRKVFSDVVEMKSAFSTEKEPGMSLAQSEKIVGKGENGKTKWVVHRNNQLNPKPPQPSSDKQAKAPKEDSLANEDLSVFSAKEDPLTKKSMALKGRIELREGLALAGDGDHIVIYRTYKNERKEFGQVYLDEGEFEIYVEENRGLLVAELRNNQGAALGKGSVPINQLLSEKNQVEVTGYFIDIKPMAFGFTGQIFAAGSGINGRSTIPNAKVELLGFEQSVRSVQDGSYLDIDAQDSSLSLIRVSHKEYWSTLQYTKTGISEDVELYSEKLISSLFGLIFDRNEMSEAKEKGVIWGVVRKDNKEVSGAVVKSDSEDQARPIYFNEDFLPDPSLQSTSSNGLFVFVNVETGSTGIEVKIDSSVSDLKVIPVENKTVSRLDFNIRDIKQVPIEFYEAFDSSDSVPTTYRVLGSERDYETFSNGQGGIEFNRGHDPLFIEVDATETHRSLTLTHQREDSIIGVPMISNRWIQEAYSYSSIRENPLLGTIVGFVQSDESFRLELDRSFAEAQLLFFDANGDFMRDSSERKAVGYIILNVEQGIKSVLVDSLDPEDKAYSSNLTLVEPNIVSVMTHGL